MKWRQTMANDQQRGTQAAQHAHDQDKQLDTSKMNSGERDAALSAQRRLQELNKKRLT